MGSNESFANTEFSWRVKLQLLHRSSAFWAGTNKNNTSKQRWIQLGAPFKRDKFNVDRTRSNCSQQQETPSSVTLAGTLDGSQKRDEQTVHDLRACMEDLKLSSLTSLYGHRGLYIPAWSPPHRYSEKTTLPGGRAQGDTFLQECSQSSEWSDHRTNDLYTIRCFYEGCPDQGWQAGWTWRGDQESPKLTLPLRARWANVQDREEQVLRAPSACGMIRQRATPTPEGHGSVTWASLEYRWGDFSNKICALIFWSRTNAHLIISSHLFNDIHDLSFRKGPRMMSRIIRQQNIPNVFPKPKDRCWWVYPTRR